MKVSVCSWYAYEGVCIYVCMHVRVCVFVCVCACAWHCTGADFPCWLEHRKGVISRGCDAVYLLVRVQILHTFICSRACSEERTRPILKISYIKTQFKLTSLLTETGAGLWFDTRLIKHKHTFLTSVTSYVRYIQVPINDYCITLPFTV